MNLVLYPYQSYFVFSAEDIIGYLRSRAHPHVAAKLPVVPEVGG